MNARAAAYRSILTFVAAVSAIAIAIAIVKFPEASRLITNQRLLGIIEVPFFAAFALRLVLNLTGILNWVFIRQIGLQLLPVTILANAYFVFEGVLTLVSLSQHLQSLSDPMGAVYSLGFFLSRLISLCFILGIMIRQRSTAKQVDDPLGIL